MLGELQEETNLSELNEPAFIYADACDIGLITVVQSYDDIPLELLPEEHLYKNV